MEGSNGKSNMKAFDFCRLHTLSLDRLKLILGRNDITSGYVLSSEECNLYHLSLKNLTKGGFRGRKKSKKEAKKELPIKNKSRVVDQLLRYLRYAIKNPGELIDISKELSSLNTKKDFAKFKSLKSLEINKG